MGASLLDAVLAETLDPAYAQAAAARAARPEGAPAERRWPRGVLVAITMALAGLLVAVAWNQLADSEIIDGMLAPMVDSAELRS